MSNVVGMEQSCEFLLSRAARHRRAGRYDEAMSLLSKAKDRFGISEQIELECAQVYEELGCDEEAMRAYRRIVRLRGVYQDQALYQLTISSARRADFARAVSYYQRLAGLKQIEIPRESLEELGNQLAKEADMLSSRSRKARARALEQRAAACLQAGKAVAAERDMRHAIALRPTAQGLTLLSCCLMIREKYKEAIECAELAHKRAPRRVQTICVLADACAAAGEMRKARRWMYIAAMRAEDMDDLLAAAIESAKYGEDHLTLHITMIMLRRSPFHVRAMLMRACALANLGRLEEAGRLFGRLSGLLPEDVVCETYFRMMKEGKAPKERLSLGLDFTHQDGVETAKELVAVLYEDPAVIRTDAVRLRRICRQCFWAIRSPLAGSHVKTVALILMGALDTPETQEIMLDALLEPYVSDNFKGGVLQTMTSRHGFKPYDVDFGGKLVCLAAGGVSSKPVRSTELNQKIVQRVADAIARQFPDAPRVLLPLYLAYADRYGTPKKRQEYACSAALEYIYHVKDGRSIPLSVIAQRYGVSERLCAMLARRIMGLKMNDTQE